MDRSTWWIFIFSIIIFNNVHEIKSKECLNNPILFKHIYKALIYMEENISDLNIDAYLGVSLAHARLRRLKVQDNLLNDVRYMSEKIMNEFQNSNLRTGNIYLFNVKYHLKNDDILNNFAIDANYTLPCYETRYKKSKMDTILKPFIIQSLLKSDSSPNEIQSDMCLSELMDNYNSSIYCNRECKVSSRCQRIMNSGRSIGYSTTHRLLYWMFYRVLNCCHFEEKQFKQISGALCCNILKQKSSIEDIGYPVALIDLLMEQVVLCTMSGYKDLLTQKLVYLVMNWQRSSGCWGNFMRLQKRSTTSLGPDACSSHMTGLGVLLLVLSLQDCHNPY